MSNSKQNEIIDCIQNMSEHTTLVRYIKHLYEDMFFDNYYEQYKENIVSVPEGERPFLTVLIRTQGKREEGLREALLCVMAQTFTDYEIIIIGHKATKECKQIIHEILDDQQEEFRQKIRFVELDEGTRTAPLNLGFSLARGQYISVFDDDDILFDNWADCFYRGFKEHDGQILHSYAFAQNWQNLEKLGYRAESSPKANYCEPFDLARQLAVNKCPLMTLAFPTVMFQKYGITFNETLNVMEDWEYFMRLAYVVGVADIPEPTAIYRFWQNVENSATLHSQEDWDESFAEIQENLSRFGFYFPESYAKDIVKNITKNYKQDITEEENKKSTLYYSKGEPFHDLMTARAVNTGVYPEFNYWFPLKVRSNKISAMRFDISDESLFLLKRIDIEVIFLNGEKKIIPFEDCVHTGMKFHDDILFMYRHPEVIWEFEDERYIECVHISGEIKRFIERGTLSTKLLDIFLAFKNLRKKRYFHKKGWF